MAEPQEMKVLDHCQISPPPGSVPTSSLPLTFFDILMLICTPMQRLFFYEFPHSTLHFTQTTLPILKTSLSLTLQHFFPFAANLMCPPPPHKPHILYTDGNSITFTVVESTCDLNQVTGNHARDVRELHPFVPQLPPARVSSDGTRVVPLLAVQVTVFPNSGVCIGVSFLHVAADGRSFDHFMKSWASVYRSRQDLTCVVGLTSPCFGRDHIEDPHGLESILLKEWWDSGSNLGSLTDVFEDKVRATFVMGPAHIERLKYWVSLHGMNNNEAEPVHASTFVVTCAVLWVCLVKSLDTEVSNLQNNNDKLCHFIFVADCRNRLEFSIPVTYFGNCLAACFVPLKRSDLVGENGIIVAAKAIGNKVKELESGALRGAEKWVSDLKKIYKLGDFLTVAGSPKFLIYETDFGWGRPIKCEFVHIDVSGPISLTESRNKDGGVEIGLALTKARMNVFNTLFEQVLKLF